MASLPPYRLLTTVIGHHQPNHNEVKLHGRHCQVYPPHPFLFNTDYYLVSNPHHHHSFFLLLLLFLLFHKFNWLGRAEYSCHKLLVYVCFVMVNIGHFLGRSSIYYYNLYSLLQLHTIFNVLFIYLFIFSFVKCYFSYRFKRIPLNLFSM